MTNHSSSSFSFTPHLWCCLALGSNVEPRHHYINQAIERLCQTSVLLAPYQYAQRYESPALLPENSPQEWDIPFINTVIAGYTELMPDLLLSIVKALEQEIGRRDRGHWGPREIDIDIIACGPNQGHFYYHRPNLTIPHPRLMERLFVLQPLVDIAPNWIHPEPGTYANISAEEQIKKLIDQGHNKISPLSSDSYNHTEK
jgi:2-amino-4-hydroxy-6-hydroxymethyldihydropteridine diphosphokinase